MDINKLFLWLNTVPIFSTGIFCVCIKTLVPDQYKSYIDGALLLAVAIFFAGPFVINYFLLRTVALPRQRLTSVALGILIFMGVINLLCLIFMYADQFETSRGFALLACGGVYVCAFLPSWAIFLVLLSVIKKRISS